MAAQSLAQEPELNHHTGPERLVGNFITKPHDELAYSKRVDYLLLFEVVVICYLEHSLGRFWNIMQYLIMKFVVNRYGQFSNHRRSKLFCIWSNPMLPLKQQMMDIAPRYIPASIFALVPFAHS